MPERNPIIEVYNNIPIRQCNFFKIRIPAVVYKTLLLESERTGLPISRILIYSSRPCEACTMTDVVVFEKGKEIKVKRGIFSRHTPQTSSTSIIKQKNAKKLG